MSWPLVCVTRRSSVINGCEMKEVRFFFVPNAAENTELPADEATHASRVLRLASGDEMFLMDGNGCFYRAMVTVASAKRCMYEIKETLPQEKSWRGHIHVAMAPTKMMDRTEWFCEKAVEVGLDEITLLNCKFSERKITREDRIEKIIVSAVKQSRKPWKPTLNAMTAFKDFIVSRREGRKFIAHCYDEIPRKDFFSQIYPLSLAKADESITVLIGPEGDFSIDEVELAMANGYESISLGTSRLRTETAALSATVMANLAMRK